MYVSFFHVQVLRLFLLHAMKANRERVEVCLHSCSISALDEAEWPASRLSGFTPAEKNPLCTMTKMLGGGSRSVLDVSAKTKYLSPSEIQYPDRPARGLGTISITALQTIKWTNWNTVAANTGIFHFFTFENTHLSLNLRIHFPSHDKLS
jgi:hypothetical protein